MNPRDYGRADLDPFAFDPLSRGGKAEIIKFHVYSLVRLFKLKLSCTKLRIAFFSLKNI